MSASPSSTAVQAPVAAPATASPLRVGSSEDDAATRLAASRERLRDALVAIAHPPPRASLFADGIANVGNQLLDRFKSLPMASALLEGANAWWQRHPLHRALGAADAASKQLIGPVARRKPEAVLLIAVGSGILLALGRPWRWLLRPTTVLRAMVQVGRAAFGAPSAKAWRKAFSDGSVNH